MVEGGPASPVLVTGNSSANHDAGPLLSKGRDGRPRLRQANLADRWRNTTGVHAPEPYSVTAQRRRVPAAASTATPNEIDAGRENDSAGPRLAPQCQHVDAATARIPERGQRCPIAGAADPP